MPISQASRYVLATILVASICAYGGSAAHAAGEEDRIDCSNAQTTVDMNFCADKEFSAADAALNAAYQRALKAVPRLATEKPYDAASWEAALRASQRAWVAFRDAECKTHVAMFWGGGTGTTVSVLGCMIDLTKSRTKDIDTQYDQR